MHRFPIFILVLIATASVLAVAQPPQKTKTELSGESGQETHLKEAGSAVVLARSAFAHGYRHGYEEGYHLGNIDVNMGRLARTKRDQFHGVSQGYSSQFGPKKSFEAGFESGLPAGYSDGFMGRSFRGVEVTRSLARALERAFPAESSGQYFDQGLASGYGQGFQKGTAAPALAMPLEASMVTCPQPHSLNTPDVAAESSYCEGYRRGYVLGYTDAVVRGVDRFALEAVK
jgi:flagellar biosynthesis/type III secretory pathway protein FliH